MPVTIITGNSNSGARFCPPLNPGAGVDLYTPTLRLPMIDLAQTISAANYSHQAYSELVRSFGNRYAWKFKTWMSGQFYWLAVDKNYLVFRGSSELPDFLVDALAVPCRYLGNWVHGGFALQHKAAKKKLINVLDRMDHSKELVITGHSLGAAQAELTHLMCQRMGYRSRLVVFGKPRVFLKPSRVRFIKGSVLSVVNCSDFVTRLPRFLYTVGCSDQDLFYLCSDGSSYLNPDMDFVQEDFRMTSAIKDHSMKGYLQRLSSL